LREKEIEFRRWLIDYLKQNQGSIYMSEALNSGAEHCDCSQLTIKRYLTKWAYSGEIAFVSIGKSINGHFVYRVVLNN
jgi:hypothetical protein